VGQGQLHPAMRAHPQVLALEQVNARELIATDLIAAHADWTGAIEVFDEESAAMGLPSVASTADAQDGDPFDATFDLIVGDLSFISQTLVLPALVPLLKPGADVLMLVKPQFELQPGQVGKGGIVKDPAMYALVEQRIRDTYAELGLGIKGWFDSPITGGDGNREFFVYATKITETGS